MLVHIAPPSLPLPLRIACQACGRLVARHQTREHVLEHLSHHHAPEPAVEAFQRRTSALFAGDSGPEPLAWSREVEQPGSSMGS